MSGKTEYTRQAPTILCRLFRPLLLLLLAMIVLMIGFVFYGGVLSQIDQNAVDILGEQVKNRENYLEHEMVGSWSNLQLTVDAVNGKVQALRAAGQADLSALDSDKRTYNTILTAVSEDLIALMRTASVTGAYLVLGAGGIDPDAPQDKKGLYLRDLDPSTSASISNTDLLIKRAPIEVAEKLGITTDSDWQTQFTFGKEGRYEPFFLRPYQAALEHPDIGWADLGYWSADSRMTGDARRIVCYSVPMRLDDGTLYGVLGIELTADYLSKQLPVSELIEGQGGSYVLAVTQDGETFRQVLVNGAFRSEYQDEAGVILRPSAYDKLENALVFWREDGPNLFGCITYLPLYNTNTPFAGERWALLGIASEDDLFAFSHSVRRRVMTVGGVLLLLGMLGVWLTSVMLSRPIAALSRELGQQAHKGEPLTFGRTRIREIDHLTGEIELLSQDLYAASQKFAEILTMASIRIGGFEIDRRTETLFITQGFFDIFHRPDVDANRMTAPDFREALAALDPFIDSRDRLPPATEEVIYRLPADGQHRYVRLRRIVTEERVIGLAEDITASTLALQKIEHERDHDSLTGLLSRRAFRRSMRELFDEHRDKLGVGALLMLDLDNLKYINDSYGHDCGDQYIGALADVLKATAPADALVCRQSGDELFVFFYGYDSEQQVRNLLRAVRRRLGEKYVLLPDGTRFPVRASGGVAWYPADSTEFEQLQRFADFAMYEVKRSGKGDICDFDPGLYQNAERLERSREEFRVLLEQRRLQYVWQPIVSTATGEAYAYEALMRSDLETLRTPKDILEMAQRESKLTALESLTLFRAMDSFAEHCEKGRIGAECFAFVNSIPNQLLSPEDSARFEQRFADYLSRFVAEITENERINDQILREKRRWNRRWNAQFALDDYGSGYNSEYMLLMLAPEYVKIDMSLVRSIDRDRDKQKIVENMCSYAAERGIKLVAEGVETQAELETVVRMGVDLVQGYFIARPAAIPPRVPDGVKRLLCEIRGA
ncbi:MAG: EAL domain-containing protein [Eubacteriales bacterium]|nr:EAL domain-containing protein [Eubacteriales bacterium]